MVGQVLQNAGEVQHVHPGGGQLDYNMTNSPVPGKLSDGTTVGVQPLTTGPDAS